jgi:hypothetical protein
LILKDKILTGTAVGNGHQACNLNERPGPIPSFEVYKPLYREHEGKWSISVENTVAADIKKQKQMFGYYSRRL